MRRADSRKPRRLARRAAAEVVRQGSRMQPPAHWADCLALDGKITYIHRLWPALVRLAGRFSQRKLAAIKEVHTPAGKHKLLVTPFPKRCRRKS
jgi:hypothetical protein